MRLDSDTLDDEAVGLHADSELPEGWLSVPMSEVATPSSKKVEPAESPTARYLSLEHIESGTSRILGYGSGADVNSTKAVFCAGDVLYGKLRPYLNKVCIPDFDGICSTDILVFPASRHLDSRYLMRYLSLSQVVAYANHHSAGVQLPRVAFSALAVLKMPLPPLAEQRRIVAKVEELLGRVRAVRERLARVSAILKRFRQSVLAAACSGRLTADWRSTERDFENADDLVARIATSRAIKPPSRPRLESDFEHELPENWTYTTIGFLAEPVLSGKPFVTSGSRGWAQFVAEQGPYFIRSENINTEYLRLEEALRVRPPSGPETDRSQVHAGDLLLTITGNNVGRTAVVPVGIPNAHVSQHVAIIRMSPLIEVDYIWLWLRSIDHGQAQLQKHFYGYTKPGLNLDQIKGVVVGLPPLAEQQEIVRRVDALFALADKIEARVQAATARVEKNTQAILAKAFRGELVPTEAELARQEGRDYEPASVLLQRIRAERAQTPAGRPSASARRRRSSARSVEESSDDETDHDAEPDDLAARARSRSQPNRQYEAEEMPSPRKPARDTQVDSPPAIDETDREKVMATIGHQRSHPPRSPGIRRPAGPQNPVTVDGTPIQRTTGGYGTPLTVAGEGEADDGGRRR